MITDRNAHQKRPQGESDGAVMNDIETIIIDYSQLMDLRIDFAFKTFADGNPEAMTSLLNAIFANGKIKRIVKSVRIKNPNLDKKSIEDKLSILDVRAELDDGTDMLIEMHMYGLEQLKAKIIRSWARAYSEELETGKSYTSQPPTVMIAFANGVVEPTEKPENTKNKIHRVCMIMDKEDGTVFTEAMELHIIDMKAFAKAINEADSINIKEAKEDMFAYWLSVITEKEIVNKDIIENARKEKEVIQMAVSAIARQSQDKMARQAYQRRKDDIYFYNMERANDKQIAEDATRRAEKAEAEIKQLRQQIAAMQANQN
ncbi:MAG: Rpn family recombination-promoting nuclease/putative transposase [Defluviitaleaceae bacterium]|nr:Rpn family recombination-promoting nuclease/putative transposase [Defluviitaleaceae bacterium]